MRMQMTARFHKEALHRANGSAEKYTTPVKDPKTEYGRWRLRDDRGRHTWHYLQDDVEARNWQQTVAEKWYLGLPTMLPELNPATRPLQSAKNGLDFFSKLQLEHGDWGCGFGGPLFLLPGLIITLYVTDMPLTQAEQTEIIRYLFNVQNIGNKNGGDGGWGLHIEADSSVYGTAMNYTVLRLLGVSPEDPRMRKARGCLYDLGSALNSPHWAKFWLAVLGVMRWEIVNPVPPELWLLPDWVPFAPWRWWVHMRQAFLPMGYVWSKRWTYPEADSDPLVRQLRQELFTMPYEEIKWARYRNAISPTDNYHPKSWVLNLINFFLVLLYIPYLRFGSLVKKAEQWAWHLIQIEDANTDFGNLASVNTATNFLACYIEEGPEAESVWRHRDRIHDYLWVSKDGMTMNGTNGLQTWDTSFAIQATIEAGFAIKPEYHSMLLKALEFLEDQQILEHAQGYEDSPAYSDPPTAKTAAEAGYRHPRRGAWGFSNRTQGYTVSDCVAEALKAVLMLQNMPNPRDRSGMLFPALITEKRLEWAVDILLSMQNANGGCASYEVTRGSVYLEYLNAAEVFGRIMIEYNYPECTTACVTALQLFRNLYPGYRPEDIQRFITRAVAWIRTDQREDGSWYGSWGICFTYAGMFALESLATQGETHANSERVQRACKFFLNKQNEDGGWGESYKSCELGKWCHHSEGSQVVQTAWVVIALLYAQYPDRGPIDRAVKLLMHRQRPTGEWLPEGIEGVFNKSCMISYPNYKFIFPIKALGMYAKRFGDVEMNGTV